MLPSATLLNSPLCSRALPGAQTLGRQCDFVRARRGKVSGSYRRPVTGRPCEIRVCGTPPGRGPPPPPRTRAAYPSRTDGPSTRHTATERL